MGSKFGQHRSVQSTPKVCRKPPDVLPAPWPPLNQRILQAWGRLVDVFPGPMGPLSQTFAIYPSPGGTYWDGSSPAAHVNMRCELTIFPATESASIKLSVNLDGVPLAVWTWSDLAPPTVIAYDSTLLTYTFTIPTRTMQCRVTD